MPDGNVNVKKPVIIGIIIDIDLLIDCAVSSAEEFPVFVLL